MRNTTLLMEAAAVAMLIESSGKPIVGRERTWNESHQPDNRGRRAEKDAVALAKAEAKRRRKAEKRAAHNAV